MTAHTGPPAAEPPAPLKTGSLWRRTVVAVLVMLVILLGAGGATIELVLGERLRTQIEQRLTDRAATAASLMGTVNSDDLAQRLSIQGLSVLIRTPDGSSSAAGPSQGELRQGELSRGGDAGKRAPRTTAAPNPAPPAQAPGGSVTIVSSRITADDEIITLVSTLSDGAQLTLAADAHSVTDTLAQLRLVMFSAGAAFLAIAALCLLFVVRSTLRPLDRMTQVARSITAGNRGRRLNPQGRRTEIGRVALAFDEMLDSVEGAEQVALDAETRVRAFVSDAAHELRTPMAGMLAAADTLVRNPGNADESERLAAHIAREAGRASRLVDDMLTMARVDGGLLLERREVDLAALMRADSERHALRHPQLEIVLDLPATAVVSVDSERISQVVNNLVDNAAQATGGAGRVAIGLASTPGGWQMVVEDSGPGVPTADRERIFDRFVRLDASRSSARGGAGLGLPIARGITEAHGGTLRYVDLEGGPAFVVTLPAE